MTWIDRFVALWRKADASGKVDLERRLFLRGFAVTSAGLVVPHGRSMVIPPEPTITWEVQGAPDKWAIGTTFILAT